MYIEDNESIIKVLKGGSYDPPSLKYAILFDNLFFAFQKIFLSDVKTLMKNFWNRKGERKSMIRTIETKTVIEQKEISLAEECSCDYCKKIIYRRRPPQVIGRIPDTLNGYLEDLNQYKRENNLAVSFYYVYEGESSISPETICEECILKEVKKSLNYFNEVKIERINTECYELGEDKSDTK